MRSISDMLLLSAPAIAGVLLVLLFAMPMQTWIPLSPNVGWLMTLIVATFCPPAWPRWVAFGIGLLQDVVMGTPLGSQALLSLLLVEMVHGNARRQQHQLFRVGWLEAAGVLVALNFLLWLVLHVINSAAPPLEHALFSGAISAVWYPFFYWPLERFCRQLSGAV